ncbi:MAG: class I SAM-dependent methyltransferase [Candidatus Parvibacillus calidus]|nr:MAG: class I SAM-dependent methyltransferase [Candidatus Parvibacillus calidus]
MPPSGLIYTGRGDFIRAGKYWLERFIREGGLKPEDSVLDIGSGIGRMAVPMTKYLTSGRYEGFDAVRQGVDWCKSNIQRKYPNFNFIYADLDNDLYKSKGFNAAEYRFDYPDENFDFAISISVFTHMLKDEIINYLRETSRVLKKGGVLFATFLSCLTVFNQAGKPLIFPINLATMLLWIKMSNLLMLHIVMIFFMTSALNQDLTYTYTKRLLE